MEDVKSRIEKGLVFARYPQSWGGMLTTGIFGVLLMPIRLLIFILTNLIAFSIWAVLSHLGFVPAALFVLRLQARVWLWCLGVWWIQEKNLKSNIVLPDKCVFVSNHLEPIAVLLHPVGFHEIVWFFMKYRPSFVAKAGVAKAPMIGVLTKQIGTIFVERKVNATKIDKAGERRKGEGGGEQKSSSVTSEILQAAKGRKMMHLCIFPEGTTTNGEQILKFRSGGFVPLLPVAPFVFKFEGYRRGIDFDPHYTTVGAVGFAFGLMSQPSIGLSVEYLPVQYPLDGETPRDYANRIQTLVAKASSLPVVSQTYADKKALEDVISDGHLTYPALYEIQRVSLDRKNVK